jgi:hypothetical protein
MSVPDHRNASTTEGLKPWRLVVREAVHRVEAKGAGGDGGMEGHRRTCPDEAKGQTRKRQAPTPQSDCI